MNFFKLLLPMVQGVFTSTNAISRPHFQQQEESQAGNDLLYTSLVLFLIVVAFLVLYLVRIRKQSKLLQKKISAAKSEGH